MPENLLALADKAWRGEPGVPRPMTYIGQLEEVAQDIAFVPSFGNVTAIKSNEGLILIDSGSQMFAGQLHEQIRSWSDAQVHTVVFTHGHVDHVFGVGSFDEEAATKGWQRPRVVAHTGVPRRFDRYKLTAGYNTIINQRQFRRFQGKWPTEYRYPDEVFRRELVLDIGGVRLELHHGKGETDDHTWVWVPDRKLLCCGDFFIWTSPNAGNPQKVQRYPSDWAMALRKMADLGAELLLPGHGLPIEGSARIKQSLQDAAQLLETLHDQTVELMNKGARLDEIIHSVRAPEELLGKPYLRPVYDEPEFVVRNVWRLYGGWYDGNPANLKPAPERELARELASLAGGAERLAERAIEVATNGNLRLAGHLAEIASLSEWDNKLVHEARARVNQMRVDSEASTMSKGIFGWAASESKRIAEGGSGGS